VLALWILIAARVLPLALFAPIFGGGLVPRVVQLGLGAGLVALVGLAQPLDVAAQAAALPPAALLALAVKEAAVGAVLAIVAALPIAAAEGAGRLLDVARGAVGEDRVGPSDDMTSPLGALYGMAALVVFFGIGGHLAVVRAVAGSYQSLPILEPRAVGDVAGAAAHLVGAALGLALPALIAGLVVELAAAAAVRAGGAVGRALPAETARHVAVVGVAALGLIATAAGVAGLLRAALDLAVRALAGP